MDFTDARDLRTMLDQALETLLWSETVPVVYTTAPNGTITDTRLWEYGPDGNEPEDFAPADDFFSVADIDADSKDRLERELIDFCQAAHAQGDLLSEWTADQAGHDFILTRNGHGAGFWDRGMASGDALTQLCKPFGGLHIYGGNADGSVTTSEG